MDVISFLLQVQIRLIREKDLAALEWDGEYTHFRRIYADTYERTMQGRSLMWVADLPTQGVIGQVFIQLICDRPELADGLRRAYLYAFRIRPEFRSQGLGSTMLAVVEDDLSQRGFSWVTLNVARDNPRARKLYERHGYLVVAAEPGIWSFPDENGLWHTREEPAWRMQKYLE